MPDLRPLQERRLDESIRQAGHEDHQRQSNQRKKEVFRSVDAVQTEKPRNPVGDRHVEQEEAVRALAEAVQQPPGEGALDEALTCVQTPANNWERCA